MLKSTNPTNARSRRPCRIMPMFVLSFFFINPKRPALQVYSEERVFAGFVCQSRKVRRSSRPQSYGMVFFATAGTFAAAIASCVHVTPGYKLGIRKPPVNNVPRDVH